LFVAQNDSHFALYAALFIVAPVSRLLVSNQDFRGYLFPCQYFFRPWR
jgi:hypothetical protein